MTRSITIQSPPRGLGTRTSADLVKVLVIWDSVVGCIVRQVGKHEILGSIHDPRSNVVRYGAPGPIRVIAMMLMADFSYVRFEGQQ